ncbi:membrane-associated protein, putative [Bodo saltans]|uniref:Membrane-associated protein, putative n=1 Tax=Bodo saltans TaxID=75058 RepID=A0A0S4J4T1_BODSA|nr:membrane-associated protein, putative [Bodo saltans]|eukprot:CUG80353.1 membrane-associated protein, putative [Bodo saltans]
MSHETAERPPKPHSDSAFKQQRLPSFYPQHTAAAVSIALLLTAVVFIPIGVVIVVESDNLFELDIRYDDVNHYKFPGLGHSSFSFNSTTMSAGTNCKKLLTLTKTIQGPVYMYYRLKGFHQNYRQYQESRDDAQLIGDTVDGSGDYCDPLSNPGQLAPGGSADGRPYGNFLYNPCGLIAWSLFNDTISLYKVSSSATPIDTTDPTLPSNVNVVCVGDGFTAASVSTNAQNLCTKSGIAFAVDREDRFKAPKLNTWSWTNAGQPSSADPFLAGGFYAKEAGHKLPVSTDEDLMVWARTSSMPDFLKLYRVIQTELPQGDYLVDIMERFDTVSFQGEKHLVLATRSWIGAKNYVLGVALLVLGCLAFVSVLAIFILKCLEDR